ncbi:ABC transporter substrate-binding protein [Hahella sp. CCB-MM4]|uniref:substrate-binding periplasmic protein n=1 Tax=Hahella sp. (strain CCB-MM4) TaxID=1926491 RepID=UPI00143D2E65|nr:transporter substrate-binding domain-containing protein [Hahella sp. CCB-MM4]
MVKTLLVLLVSGLLAQASVQADTIRIGTGEYAPWTTESSEHFGLVNRIVAEAFRRQGFTVDFVFVPWVRARADTESGRFDASSFWFRRPEYETQYLLSDTIFVQREVFFHLKQTKLPSWNSLEDLKDRVFGATIGYSYTQEFWDMAKGKILQVEETSSDLVNFRKLVRGRIDVFPCEEVTGWRILNKEFDRGIANLVTTQDKPLRTAEATLLMIRDKPESVRLIDLFNQALEKMKADGTIDRYYDDMLGGVY